MMSLFYNIFGGEAVHLGGGVSLLHLPLDETLDSDSKLYFRVKYAIKVRERTNKRKIGLVTRLMARDDL